MAYLVVGLGNPGKEYEDTRHNLGFACVDHCAALWRFAVKTRQCEALTGTTKIAGREVTFAKPLTFMNASGRSVAELARRLDCRGACVLVIHDDLDLPVGRMRVRARGGAGGHKGIISILDELGSETFSRLRVGIGRGHDPERYVLERFEAEERDAMAKTIAMVPVVLEEWVRDGIQAAMNRFNRAESEKEG